MVGSRIALAPMWIRSPRSLADVPRVALLLPTAAGLARPVAAGERTLHAAHPARLHDAVPVRAGGHLLGPLDPAGPRIGTPGQALVLARPPAAHTADAIERPFEDVKCRHLGAPSTAVPRRRRSEALPAAAGSAARLRHPRLVGAWLLPLAALRLGHLVLLGRPVLVRLRLVEPPRAVSSLCHRCLPISLMLPVCAAAAEQKISRS